MWLLIKVPFEQELHLINLPVLMGHILHRRLIQGRKKQELLSGAGLPASCYCCEKDNTPHHWSSS